MPYRNAIIFDAAVIRLIAFARLPAWRNNATAGALFDLTKLVINYVDSQIPNFEVISSHAVNILCHLSSYLSNVSQDQILQK